MQLQHLTARCRPETTDVPCSVNSGHQVAGINRLWSPQWCCALSLLYAHSCPVQALTLADQQLSAATLHYNCFRTLPLPQLCSLQWRNLFRSNQKPATVTVVINSPHFSCFLLSAVAILTLLITTYCFCTQNRPIVGDTPLIAADYILCLL